MSMPITCYSRCVTILFWTIILPFYFAQNGLAQVQKPVKIWDSAPHNAFTDLIYHEGKWYCTFREAPGHVPRKEGEDGKIRVIASEDGDHWESLALLAKENYDLRDPKISVMEDGTLMLLMGASDFRGAELVGRVTHLSFLNKNGKGFSEPQPVRLDSKIKTDKDWLWRVTWHEKFGYGMVYQSDNTDTIHLVRTRNGKRYNLVKSIAVTGNPNEATIRFLSDESMIVLLRREGGDQEGYIGISQPPYEQWFWRKVGFRIGGPNLLILSNVSFLMGTRVYDGDDYRTSLFTGNLTSKWKEVAQLPSGGDTSYPGISIYGDEIWISYYSSHEGKASVYLVKVPIELITG
jgi:hypothetical protein